MARSVRPLRRMCRWLVGDLSRVIWCMKFMTNLLFTVPDYNLRALDPHLRLGSPASGYVLGTTSAALPSSTPIKPLHPHPLAFPTRSTTPSAPGRQYHQVGRTPRFRHNPMIVQFFPGPNHKCRSLVYRCSRSHSQRVAALRDMVVSRMNNTGP